MTSDSKQLMAFSLPDIGTYELEGLAMGIKTAPSHFSYIMDYIFSSLKQEYGIFTYYDDVLMFAPTIDQLNVTLKNCWEKVEYNGMSLSMKKCQFGHQEVDI